MLILREVGLKVYEVCPTTPSPKERQGQSYLLVDQYKIRKSSTI